MSGDRITIQRAGIDAAAALAALGGRTFRATYAGDMPSAALDEYVRAHFGVEQQRAELTDPACEVLVARQGSTMLGYALLRAVTGPLPAAAAATAQLERLYVAEQAQSRGVGTALFARVIEVASSNGHARMWLTVWEHNTRALAVYRRWGFTDVGQVDFELADEVQRDRVLTREVG